jgi:phosphinothricin acetyltransferase
LRVPEISFFVAEEAGAVLGTIALARKDGYGEVKSMFVDPAARGRGVGRALMAALEDHARAGGAHSLWAGVSAENPAGLGFHRAIGFAEIARLPEVGFKFGRWMDLVLMQKIL